MNSPKKRQVRNSIGNSVPKVKEIKENTYTRSTKVHGDDIYRWMSLDAPKYWLT